MNKKNVKTQLSFISHFLYNYQSLVQWVDQFIKNKSNYLILSLDYPHICNIIFKKIIIAVSESRIWATFLTVENMVAACNISAHRAYILRTRPVATQCHKDGTGTRRSLKKNQQYNYYSKCNTNSKRNIPLSQFHATYFAGIP